MENEMQQRELDRELDDVMKDLSIVLNNHEKLNKWSSHTKASQVLNIVYNIILNFHKTINIPIEDILKNIKDVLNKNIDL